MNITIRKIGNSEGIIIPKDVLDRLGLKAGDSLAVEERNGGLMMMPMDDEFERQVAHAERFMEKYKTTLKKLAE